MWKLSKIEITYPSLNSEINNTTQKYYAITSLYFKYGNFNLQFGFDLSNDKMFSLVDFTNKKNPNILEDTDISKLDKILKKHNLPIFNPHITNENIDYIIFENDDDGNYDYETNNEYIKSGDYGIPVLYNSNFLISEYEKSSNQKLKKNLENLIFTNLSLNLKKYIST